MFNKTNIAIGLAVIAVVIGLVGLVGGNSAKLGGTTNYDVLDTSGGYKVDGTTVIGSDGACLQLNGVKLAPSGTGTATWVSGSCS